MKHFITLTFLMMCLSSKLVYSSEENLVCHSPMTAEDIATYIVETCEISIEATLEEVQENIMVSEDTNGPGYKKVTFNFGEEYIGSQILIDYKNEEEVCYTENNSDYFCPSAYSN